MPYKVLNFCSPIESLAIYGSIVVELHSILYQTTYFWLFLCLLPKEPSLDWYSNYRPLKFPPWWVLSQLRRRDSKITKQSTRVHTSHPPPVNLSPPCYCLVALLGWYSIGHVISTRPTRWHPILTVQTRASSCEIVTWKIRLTASSVGKPSLIEYKRKFCSATKNNVLNRTMFILLN